MDISQSLLVRTQNGINGTRHNLLPNDPLFNYYRSNEDIIRKNNYVWMMLSLLKSLLFSRGFSFWRKGMVVTPEKKSIEVCMSHYWIPFCHHSVDFIVARGYLVFSIRQNNKEMIPFVPDFEQLDVEVLEDEDDKSTIIKAAWADGKLYPPLYILNDANPFGITFFNQTAPISRIKDFLRQLSEMIANRMVISYRNSSMPIMLEHGNSRKMVTGGNDKTDIDYDDDIYQHINDNAIIANQDQFFLERINQISRANAISQHAANVQYVGEHWAQANMRKHKGIERNFAYIPQPLHMVNLPPAQMEPDFLQRESQLIEQMYTAFGLPYNSINSNSGRQVATGIELQQSNLTSTIKQWAEVFHTLLTDVYCIINDIDDCIDVQPVNADNSSETEADTDTNRKRQKMSHEHNEPDADEPKKKSPQKKNTLKSRIDRQRHSDFIEIKLNSANSLTLQQASDMYHLGVINFATFQRMALAAHNLDPHLADKSVDEPIRNMAQTVNDHVKLQKLVKDERAKTNESLKK